MILYKGFWKCFPVKIFKYYIRPFLLRKNIKNFNAEKYFESWYQSMHPNQFNDRITNAYDYEPLNSRYHYSCLEKMILEWVYRQKKWIPNTILDIGSGAGHWIDFSKELFSNSKITGIDLSETCIQKLKQKYSNDSRIQCFQMDVSHLNEFHESFDLILGISVFFNIVDDGLWEKSLMYLKHLLSPRGFILISGYFGHWNRPVQFHYCDEYSDWKSYFQSNGSGYLVNKKIRSYRTWKKSCQKVGLKVIEKIKNPKRVHMGTPENNLLIITHGSIN